MEFTGHVTAGYKNKRTGLFTPVLEQKNLILYGAADIVAGLLNGDNTLRLSHMYFQYQNTSGDVTITPSLDRSSGRADFSPTALTGAGPDYEDWLRVPSVTQGRIFQSPTGSANYAGNNLYLTATSAAAPAQVGNSPAHNYFAASGGNGPSKIFSVALVSAPNPNDSSTDKIFSRLNLITPLTVLAGSHPCMFWSIRCL
jgi:hypothetical protein